MGLRQGHRDRRLGMSGQFQVWRQITGGDGEEPGRSAQKPLHNIGPGAAEYALPSAPGQANRTPACLPSNAYYAKKGGGAFYDEESGTAMLKWRKNSHWIISGWHKSCSILEEFNSEILR